MAHQEDGHEAMCRNLHGFALRHSGRCNFCWMDAGPSNSAPNRRSSRRSERRTGQLRKRFGRKRPRLGRLAASLLLRQLRMRLGISADDLQSIDHIANVACPVFIMSGEQDRTTRPDDTEALFSRAQLPKQLWFVPKAGHVALHKAAGTEYESRVLAFLEQM
jgi:prepilin-type processing-associated H-X9-DG protein